MEVHVHVRSFLGIHIVCAMDEYSGRVLYVYILCYTESGEASCGDEAEKRPNHRLPRDSNSGLTDDTKC